MSGDFVKTGGMDRANHALAWHLSGRGHDVRLVAHRVDPDLANRPGVTIRRVPKPLGSYLLGEPLLRRYGRREARRYAPHGARVVVNGGNCDWADVNWVHYVHAAWTPRPAAGAGGVRRAKAALTHRLALAAERSSLRRARVVVANSGQTRALLIDRLGLPPDRVHTVYYGVDPDEFRPPTPAERDAARERLGWRDGRPTLAFIGALGDLRKGLDTLLAAWRTLREGPGWDARLAVVGTGAAAGRLRDEARGLGDSVEFLGFRPDVPAVLRACDALASPARYEAYGLNVHEALCCGLPALASRSSGVAERFPAGLRDLLLPDPDDAADLAARLRAWRDGRAGYARAALTLSETLRAETWDDMAGRFLDAVGPAS